MDREDGEMSDDNAMLVDDVKEPITFKNEVTVVYKADKAGLIIEKLEKVDASKIEERAKRFGLNLTGNRVITQRQIDELYSNFGIESGNERHFRFDSINLSGVDGLTTREIFQYLEDYKPVSLEWIDETSCNIVCQDHISAALALLVHSREIRDENLKQMLSEKSNHYWREGMPHPEKDLILMRFATNADKKVMKKKTQRKPVDDFDQTMDSVSKNPWGDLCQSWGVYDHQEVFQRKPIYRNYHEDEEDEEEEEEEPPKVIRIKNKSLASRLGKRRTQDSYSEEKSEDSSSDSEWKIKSKVPRMRMHADDEETKQRNKLIVPYSKEIKKEGYSALSIEVENSRSSYSQREQTTLSDKFKKYTSSKPVKPTYSVRSRLGDKVTPVDEEDPHSDESLDSDSYLTSRVHKVSSAVKNTSSVWSRLDKKSKDTNTQSNHSDLRHILKSRKHKDDHKKTHKKSDDLRDRLGKSKQTNLRIEIDNNYVDDL